MSDTGYSRSPKLIKGALIYLSAPMLVPVPNIIIFQYNPETMTRQLTPWTPSQNQSGDSKNPQLPDQLVGSLSQPFDPQETFSLVLELDAADALEHPATHPVAALVGVADRVAALEMLCYPPDSSATGGVLGVSISTSIGSLGGALGLGSSSADAVPRTDVPIVLFFWGPGRILPVRLTTFSVEEQQYSPTLYPLRAKVTVGLKTLDQTQLNNISSSGGNSGALDLAKACYTFTMGQKKALALANLANGVESIIGMLPI